MKVTKTEDMGTYTQKTGTTEGGGPLGGRFQMVSESKTNPDSMFVSTVYLPGYEDLGGNWETLPMLNGEWLNEHLTRFKNKDEALAFHAGYALAFFAKR